MMMDAQNQLMTKQVVTTASLVPSVDQYDLGKEGADISIGDIVSALFIPKAFTAKTGNFTFSVRQGSTITSGVLQSPDVLISKTLTAAQVLLGVNIELPIPQASMTKRYLDVAVTNSVAGDSITWSAFLVLSKDLAYYKPFAKVYNSL